MAKEKYKLGRKTTLTNTLLKEIIKNSKLGVTDKTIYIGMGIPKSTWYLWKRKGLALLEETEQRKKEYKSKKTLQNAQRLIDFVTTIKRGRQLKIMKCLKVMEDALGEHWQSAAWYLERVAYKTYGRKETIKQDIDMTIKKDSPMDEMLKLAKEAKELGYVPKDIIASNN